MRKAAASSRPCARRARRPRTSSSGPFGDTPSGCCGRERRPSRASRATGSTGTPSSRPCAPSRRRAASRPGSARTPFRPSSTTPTAYLDFALAEVLPEAAGIAEAADVFLERGAFDAAQARRYLEACRDAGLALRLHGDQFSESGAVPLAIELGARSVDHLEATGTEGAQRARALRRRRRAAPRERALPRQADAARPRARRRRRRGRARDRLQPGERVLREPAARLLARVHAASALAGRGARRVHGERGARPRPGRRAWGASPRASRRTSCCSTRPTGATSRTTSAATWSARSSAAATSRGAAVGAARARLERHADPQAAAPPGEGQAPRVRVRLRRRGRQRGRGRRGRREGRAHRLAQRPSEAEPARRPWRTGPAAVLESSREARSDLRSADVRHRVPHEQRRERCSSKRSPRSG